MRFKIALISTLLMGCCLMGCEKGVLGSDDTNGNALIARAIYSSIFRKCQNVGTM